MSEEHRSPSPADPSRRADDGARTALLVGFSRDLESALAGFLGRHGFITLSAAAPEDAAAQLTRFRPDLMVITDRVGRAVILSLVTRLGERRTTRVVVLLPGVDPEAEAVYRAAGVRVVLRMPVRPDELVRAGKGMPIEAGTPHG